MKSKDQAILEIFYVKESGNLIDWEKRIKQSDWQRELWDQTLRTKLLQMIESICWFMDTYPMQKISIAALFSFDIMQIKY